MGENITNEELREAFLNSNIDYDEFIKKLFIRYLDKKKNNKLYDIDKLNNHIAEFIITMYYSSENKLDFTGHYANFKRKYIINENRVEDVHTKEERSGLGLVYDYIQTDDWKVYKDILAVLICQINSILYSNMPYKGYGGSFRKVNASITNSDVKTEDYNNIMNSVYALNDDFTKLQDFAKLINNTNDSTLILAYVNQCLKLSCELIRIHPFLNGNGRTIRALTNLMFKWINLPPIYVKLKEKDEYILAMDEAIRLNNSNRIQKFYYYKICDSIIDLDINEKQNREEISKKIDSV